MRIKITSIFLLLTIVISQLYGQNYLLDNNYFVDRYKITLNLDPQVVKNQNLDILYLLNFQDGVLKICDSAVVKKNKVVFNKKFTNKSSETRFQKGFVRIVGLYKSKDLYPKNEKFTTPLILLNQDVDIDISLRNGSFSVDKSTENQSVFAIQKSLMLEKNPQKSAALAANLASEIQNSFVGKYFKMHSHIMETLRVDSMGRVKNSQISIAEFEKFIDYIDFSDVRIVNSPEYSGIRIVIKNFFVAEKFSKPEDVVVYIDKILSDASNGGDIQRNFYAKELFETLQQTGEPFFETAMLHIYDNYDRSWIPESRERSVKRQMEKARRLAVGAKIPELTAYDIDKNQHSTADIKKKYTILWFWDPDCDHCQEQTPILHDLYNQLSETLDFEVFAVEVNDDYERWKSFSETHHLSDWINLSTSMGEASVDFIEYFDIVTTPVVLLIDNSNDFAISARQISLEEIVEIMKKNNLK